MWILFFAFELCLVEEDKCSFIFKNIKKRAERREHDRSNQMLMRDGEIDVPWNNIIWDDPFLQNKNGVRYVDKHQTHPATITKEIRKMDAVSILFSSPNFSVTFC